MKENLFHRGILTIAGLIVLIGMICSSCGPVAMAYKRDISYSPYSPVKLKVPPEGVKKAETSYMVAFVRPTFEVSTTQARSARQALIEGYKMGGAAVSGLGLYRKMDVAQNEYLDRIREVLQADLDKILLTKNIRVLGSFKSRDELTFDEKKRAIYAFTPVIRVDVRTSHSVANQANPYIEKGKIIVSGELTLTLCESITGEKVWIKRIDAPEVGREYELITRYKEPFKYHQEFGVMGVPVTSSKMEEKDNTDQVLALTLSDFYEALGNSLLRHIDPEEWSKYLNQAESLRKQKQY